MSQSLAYNRNTTFFEQALSDVGVPFFVDMEPNPLNLGPQTNDYVWSYVENSSDIYVKAIFILTSVTDQLTYGFYAANICYQFLDEQSGKIYSNERIPAFARSSTSYRPVPFPFAILYNANSRIVIRIWNDDDSESTGFDIRVRLFCQKVFRRRS